MAEQKQITLKDVQKVELEMLLFLDKVCKENNLKYFLVGGTLLGAIRHKGFIPWDDDVDVAMFREDYDKLASILKGNQYSNGKYFYQDDLTDKGYYLSYAKIRLLNSFAYEPNFAKTKMEQRGFFIDIFPLDYCDKPSTRLKIRYKILSVYNYRCFRNSGFVLRRGGKPFWWICNLFLHLRTKNGVIKAYKRKIKYGINKSNREYVASYSGANYYPKEIFKTELFGEGTYLEFEGHQLMVPSKYIEQTSQIYGNDFMNLPTSEEDKRIHLDLSKCLLED